MATRENFGPMPLRFPEVEQYFKRLHFHLIATDKVDRSKAVLLSSCGEKAFSLIQTLISPGDIYDNDINYDFIKNRVLNHLTPKRILHHERHQLHSLTQGSDPITVFIQRLQDQANRCDLGELRDELVLTQFIFGLRETDLREKLLAKSELTLDTAIAECLLDETVQKAVKPNDASVSAVRTKSSPKFSISTGSQRMKRFSKCHSCGKEDHHRNDCKFRKAKCRSCGKIGHIAAVCRAPAERLRTNELSTQSPDQGELSHVIMSASSNNSANLIHVHLKVGNSVERFLLLLLDSGSQVTIIPYNSAKRLNLSFSDSVLPKVTAFGGHDVPVIGVIDSLKIANSNCFHSGRVLITSEGTTSILGMDFMTALGYVSFQSNPLSFSDAKIEASFRIKENASMDGLCFAPRSLPFAMKGMVETELQRLLKQGIIYPVENPMMAAPIVPVVKQAGASNPIRICGDYSLTLNKVIDPDQYCIPRLEEILEKVSSSKLYSVLDLSDAYLQVPLSPQSQLFTCISTHIGCFAYKRLQFGVSAAPLIFQEIMDKILNGISNVATYQDDIIIGAPDKNTHDHVLKLVEQRLQKFNFKINAAKSQICKSKVKFLGFVLDSGKLVPDPLRLKAFQSMNVPKDKSQLRSALGTLRHYGLFCKNFSTIARPLYLLLKKNSPWRWSPIHQNAFQKLLQTIPLGSIRGYDQSKPLFIFSDASQDGLGFVLSHDADQREIVWLGSRVLTPAEANYSNIEREALALVEAVKYFHKFIAGRKFTICCDHRPLQFIFDRKSTQSDRISARLQRWAITLRAYDYEIKYIKGELMLTADTLSRIPSNGEPLAPEVNMLQLNSLADFPSNSTLLQSIASSKDSALQKLKRYIVNGWPNHIPENMLRFSRSREEYTVQEGIVFRGLRIVVPADLQNSVLRLLHRDHPGITKMVRLARQYCWWPNIDTDINAFIRGCHTCQINARKRTRFHLSSWEETRYFLERVHIDVAHWKDYRLMVLVDSYSKWIDIQLLKDLTTATSIQALRRTIKYVGLPSVIVSDNGLNFASEEFRKFCFENFIQHTFTPPGHHASNGQVERVIQDLKFYLSKCSTDNGADLEKLVINFCLSRNTTPAVNGSVPADFVFQKSLRTRLSVICTERATPSEPYPVFIRVENKKPAAGEIIAKHGRNTLVDNRNRLVHDGDVTPRVPDPVPQPPEVSPPEFENTETPQPPLPRRSSRIRKVPDRLCYE